MRKILAIAALLLGAFHILSAIPAYPGKIQVTQPDGSVIVIQIHGDEFLHYATDEKGKVVARGKDGFFRAAQGPTQAEVEQAFRLRQAAREMQQEVRAAAGSSMTRGEHRIPVLLVAFADGKSFSIASPQASFSDLLNQEGYSTGGATGSLHDYYYENSRHAYSPYFDVYGPVTLSKSSSYYAGDGGTEHVPEAIREACSLLNDQIDFSRYDSNGDGTVDMIAMIYAGYSQAEGGGTDTIWPHQNSTSGNFDGKRLGSYVCTSELRNASGAKMSGVGPMAHEFGHALGLPDFYDSDYEKHGSCGALYSYSLMCSGSYNNSGRTPPYLNSEEQKLLGWLDDQTEITRTGALTLTPVQEGVAYRIPTSMDGEYFVFECRRKAGWDKYIGGGGLLVYHVDKSNRASLNPSDSWADYYKPVNLWSQWKYTNAINAFGSHPCFYLIPAADQDELNYSGYESAIPFPGSKRITTYIPVDWQETESDFRFTEITFDESKVTLNIRYNAEVGISGTVMNTSAKPVRGAVVSVRLTGSSTVLQTVTTDSDGLFEFKDDALGDSSCIVSVSCEGYVSTEATVAVARKIAVRDFYLRKVGESGEITFRHYDPASSSFTAYGEGKTGSSLAAAIRITSSEAAAHAGKQLKFISFQLNGSASSTADAVYVFVEVGNRRQFSQKVENPQFGEMNTVNVIGQEYFIPTGQDLYIGYGVVNAGEANPLLVQACTEENAGYMGTFSTTRSTTWSLMSSGGKRYTPVLSAAVGERVEPELGFNYIANPGNGIYKAGDRFNLALVRYEDDAPSSVSWTFDGVSVQAASVSLTAGTHTVEARLKFSDGATEVIRLVIRAE